MCAEVYLVGRPSPLPSVGILRKYKEIFIQRYCFIGPLSVKINSHRNKTPKESTLLLLTRGTPHWRTDVQTWDSETLNEQDWVLLPTVPPVLPWVRRTLAGGPQDLLLRLLLLLRRLPQQVFVVNSTRSLLGQFLDLVTPEQTLPWPRPSSVHESHPSGPTRLPPTLP